MTVKHLPTAAIKSWWSLYLASFMVLENAVDRFEPAGNPDPWGALAALLVVAGVQPAAFSRLAIAPNGSTLGRVQLRFLG
eukprot:gene22031-26989_t